MAARNGRGATQEAPPEKTKPGWARKVFTGAGSVEVSVWPKQMSSDNGDYMVYNVAAKRTYKENGEYKSVSGFRGEDIAPLIQLLAQAYDFILEEQNARE